MFDTRSVRSLGIDKCVFGAIRAVEVEVHYRGIHGELDAHDSGIKSLYLNGEGGVKRRDEESNTGC